MPGAAPAEKVPQARSLEVHRRFARATGMGRCWIGATMAQHKRNRREQAEARRFAAREKIPYQRALQRVREHRAWAPHADDELGHDLVAAWELPLAHERVAALTALAERQLAARAAELRRGPLGVVERAFAYVGAALPWDVAEVPAFAAELVEALEDGRGLVPHDETTLVNVYVDEPLRAIADSLHELLLDNDGEGDRVAYGADDPVRRTAGRRRRARGRAGGGARAARRDRARRNAA